MALFDLSLRDLARLGSAPAAASSETDLNDALLREQYRSLARIAPYHCGVAIVGTAMLGYFARETSWPVGAIVLVPACAYVLFKLVYWLAVRPRIERQGLDVIRRDLRHANIEIPTLTFVFALLAATTFGQVGPIEESLLLAASWIVAAACALCLMRLARCAVLVVSAATAPIVPAFVLSESRYSLWLAALILVASGLISYMLIENSRAFSEIIRSRFTIANMHRAAEEARQTATAIAYTDYLTGLPNRRFLLSLLADRAQTAQAGAKPFAVGLIDLDGFKPINDIHGHPAGDAVLKQVGDRLAGAMRGRGCAARMGGDEFAVVCEGVVGRDEAIALGREIRKVFAAPFPVEKLAIHVGCTSGFALFPDSADQPDQLIRLADIALYRAKKGRRGDIGVFDVGDENGAIARAKLEQALYRAVACSSIGVHFQPIVELATGRISGFESLARWRDCELGRIAPSVFIPVAEQLGLMEKLSFDLLQKAVNAAAQWPSDVLLSFNLSAEQLLRPNAGADIVAALGEFGFCASRFEVEVTETAIMKNFDAARATIDTLRAAGVRVALDDFGAGRSSLAQVRDLALDRIKIDKSFVDRVCVDPKIAGLTRSIVDMACRLELPCVAEGIESVEQLEELRQGGCAGGQGWLFAGAMPEVIAARFIAERRGLPH
ncbi:MAG TPA: EAL domain-containing protein [Roseiarcus sp.]|jgi:diguanylate cyclase (GGDEF)-like protein|nr:EAL domain-containing protein [Roseiarcus sp.]